MLEIFAERGGDPNRAGKRDALDPLLWRMSVRASRAGMPASWARRPPGILSARRLPAVFVDGSLTVQAGGND